MDRQDNQEGASDRGMQPDVATEYALELSEGLDDDEI